MTHSNLKRALAALMVVLMLVGVMPFNAFAGRVVGGGNGVPVKPDVDNIDIDVTPDVDGTTDLAKIVNKMEDIYIKYLGEKYLYADEIDAIVSEMDPATLTAARLENYYLEEEAKSLSEEDIAAINDCYEPYINFATAVERYGSNRQLARGSWTPVTGLTLSDSGASSSSFSNGVYTGTAKGSLFSKKTDTITFTNGTSETMKLTFAYSASGYNSFTVGGASASASGNAEVVLAAGGTYQVVLQSKSGMSAGTASVTIQNITFTQIATSADVTINYNSALGSVTLNGTAVSAGETVADVSTSEATTFVATPVSGATFVGWTNESGLLLSTAATYSTTLANSVTYKAVFANASAAPIWNVGGYLYDDFAPAAAKGGTMVLASTGTLPAGDYTVPSGTTLLVPYNAANTLCTTRPSFITIPEDKTSDYVPPISEYRTLYMASGANITVNGAVSVSGSQQPGGNYAGVVSGPLGYIRMSENSNITVNNGAKLYVWGFITGSGTVTAKNGAVVYEDFAVAGWRGGSMTSDMVGNDQGVFIFNSYFVQNIEVPLAYECGAKEYGVMSVNISVIGVQDSEVPFIGASGCMFNVKSGVMTKTYDGTKDRLVVSVDGDLSVDPMSISMKLGLLGSKTVNSKDYVLPITTNLSAVVDSGSLSINQDIALLPGSEIVVREDAYCTLGSGNRVIVYDADQWSGYDTSYNVKFQPYPIAVPGRTYTRTDADLVDARVQIDGTIDVTKGYIYSTTGGGNVFSTGTGKIYTGNSGTQTVTYQITQVSNQSITYVDIPVVPGLLRNADGSTTSVEGEKNLYTYADGKWSP
ncbi:MAG: hypothetical protein IKU19_06500, partial [Clostridia bacterium]|nr:hypothetical protein [Clostridia bacterium]